MKDHADNIHQNLYSRWLDEREYENINDYAKVIREVLPKEMIMTKMNKRPFGFNFTVGTDAEYQFFCKSGTVGWKRFK